MRPCESSWLNSDRPAHLDVSAHDVGFVLVVVLVEQVSVDAVGRVGMIRSTDPSAMLRAPATQSTLCISVVSLKSVTMASDSGELNG